MATTDHGPQPPRRLPKFLRIVRARPRLFASAGLGVLVSLALLATDWCGGHFIIELTREGRMDEMAILAESRPENWDGSGLVVHAERVSALIKNTIGISARVMIVAPDTLERSLGKAKRVYDKRPKG